MNERIDRTRTTAARRNRSGAASFALALSGALFVLYPAVRPYAEEDTLSQARAFASAAWRVSHVSAIFGFILLPLGLLGLRTALGSGVGAAAARAGLMTTWLGVGMTLPYYGAEAFALNAIGERIVSTGDTRLFALVEAIRMQPLQATLFAAGLLAIAAGTALAALAVWRSGAMPRGSGLPLAAGFALFVPQFFAPPPLRVAHGVLVGVGCFVLAAALWRLGAGTREDGLHEDGMPHGRAR